MFNINNISEKYSNLYLNDEIKDKFFSLLLIDLDVTTNHPKKTKKIPKKINKMS